MGAKSKRESDGLSHSRPGSVDQQAEDSFPTSDAPSFAPGAVGAPKGKTKQPTGDSQRVKDAEQKVKSGEAKRPETY